jgi:type I restriction enzyme S subunit
MSPDMHNETEGDETTPALVPKLRFPAFRETGDWEEKELVAIAPLQRGFDLTSDEIRPGNVPIIFSNGPKGFHERGMATGPGIVTGRSGTIGKMHFIESGAYWPHNTSLWVTSFEGHAPKFVFYLYDLIGFSRFASGSGVPTLNRNDAHSFVASLPPNMAEQQRIADCLGSLDELVSVQARKVEALKAHKKGLMQQLFPQEGETQPRLRFPEFQDAGEWVESRLEDLSKRGSGHTPNKSNPEYYGGELNWVSLADSKRLDRGLISETETSISEEGIRHSSAVLHAVGSVIISRDAGVGKSAVMAKPMAVSQHFIVWTCDPRRLSNWFLYHFLQVKKPLFESVASGSTIKTIGLPFFKELRLSISSLAEQTRIADCLSSLDDLISAESTKLSALKTHKKGLMQQLFPTPAED